MPLLSHPGSWPKSKASQRSPLCRQGHHRGSERAWNSPPPPTPSPLLLSRQKHFPPAPGSSGMFRKSSFNVRIHLQPLSGASRLVPVYLTRVLEPKSFGAYLAGSCVASGEWHSLSGLQLCHLQNGADRNPALPTSQDHREDELRPSSLPQARRGRQGKTQANQGQSPGRSESSVL